MTDKIDLHMHSIVSDGTERPEELIYSVKKAGISVFALTDHDAIKGSEMIQTMLNEKATSLRFIPGVEFSCRDEEGKYHILGYGYDAATSPIQDVVNLGHSYRMKKVRARLDFIDKEFGFSFPEEEIEALFALDNPGKPHIGNMMVKYGYAENKQVAIKEYINKLRIRSQYVRPEEAISGILGSGGIPVLAHPFYGDGDQLILGEEMEERLKRLMEFGIKGVEAFYSGFSDKLRQEMLGLAQKYNLYVTAGSDYHGTNKLVQLGDTGMDANTPKPAGMIRFLEDVL
jgi:predicted metal-dependent phosphoesterase TrpH